MRKPLIPPKNYNLECHIFAKPHKVYMRLLADIIPHHLLLQCRPLFISYSYSNKAEAFISILSYETIISKTFSMISIGPKVLALPYDFQCFPSEYKVPTADSEVVASQICIIICRDGISSLGVYSPDWKSERLAKRKGAQETDRSMTDL